MTRRTGDWINSYLKYTDNSEPPLLYREWIACSVLAAVLQRKCFLPWGSLTFYPNLYVVLVGPSGKCRKGTAMGVGASFLNDLGIKMAAEATTREALIRELADSEKMDFTSNGEMKIHASLTIYSQELAVFLGYNNMQLIMDLTDWYDCRDSWTYRTKNMGTDDISGVWVNLIGATTPELIQSTLPQDAIGGGLVSRMIFVFEDQKGKKVAAPFKTKEDIQLRENLLMDLEDISLMSGGFQITEGFMDRWVDWYHYQEDNPPFRSSKFQGYVHRRPNHILKLVQLMNVARTDAMKIEVQDFEKALDLLKRTEVKMPRTFGGYGEARTSRVNHKVMKFIATQGRTNVKEILQTFYSDIEDKRQLKGLISNLKAMEFIKEKVDDQGKHHLIFNEDYENSEMFKKGQQQR